MAGVRFPRHKPVTVPREMSIVEAARRMDVQGVGSLLVMDGEDLVGIVTDRDLALRSLRRRIPFDGRVEAVMTRGVVTLDVDADPADVVRMFREHTVRRLPVTDNGRVIGLIALDDVVAAPASAAVPAGRATGAGAPAASAPADLRPRAGLADLPGLADLAAAVAAEIPRSFHEGGLPGPKTVTWLPEPRLGRWRASVGDRLVVSPPNPGRPPCGGEILEVHSPAGDPPYLVRWGDGGHATFVYPGPDAEVEHLRGGGGPVAPV
ncbi:CBS domain-containing protein [Candidatus Frankia alpina]|uniref:CBS domain-containing protein n=1 Tax=Candidatus Frankia alpina TaxID=2699483 RepID=UPI0013D8129A|nr:CBS domain-containing protein [Candidatus Frankia alpina]